MHNNRTDEVGWFLRRATAIAPLERAEEHELARRSQAGDERARERLLLANLRHVVALAMRYRRYGVPIGDLVSAGNIGLCLAIGKFDPERGTRFVTYAGHWIRAQMFELVLRSKSVVGGTGGAFRSKVYFRLQRERSRIDVVVSDRAEQRRRLAASFETSEEQIDEWLARLDHRDVSLDAPYDDDTGRSGLDRLASGGAGPEEALHERSHDEALAIAMQSAIEALDARERRIVEARGLADDAVTLADLAEEFGVTRERARQLEVRAHGKLRKRLERFAPANA